MWATPSVGSCPRIDTSRQRTFLARGAEGSRPTHQPFQVGGGSLCIIWKPRKGPPRERSATANSTSGQVPDYGRDVMEWLRCCRPLLHKKRYSVTPSKRKRPENKARNPRGNHKILYSHPPKYIKGCMSSHMGRSKDHTIKRSIKNHRITSRYPLPLSPSRFLHCMNTRLIIPNPQNTIILDIKLRSPNKDKSPMSLSVLSAQATEDPHTDLQQTKRCMSQF
jgi:hypothetical protein